jgi:hypothetical protein
MFVSGMVNKPGQFVLGRYGEASQALTLVGERLLLLLKAVLPYRPAQTHIAFSVRQQKRGTAR